jgi:Prealbumin-like fold domain
VRKRTIVLAMGVILALVVGVQVVAFANHPEVSLPNSNFEIDTNANLKVDDAAPSIDWASVTETRKADKPSGSADDSFGNGSKEDTPVPAVVDGSIPPNKSDLLNFGVYLESNANGKFLNVFWHRVQEPSGTTNMDFEFNKSSTLSANGVTPVRSAGDVLIQYDLSQGGTNPQLFLSKWVTSGASSQCEAANSTPCWSDRLNLTAQGDATGSINTTAIPAAESEGLGNVSARTFGEAQIDFDALTGGSGASCESFAGAYLKSRSSDSFTAAMKDFIAPANLNLSNCAKVTIRKETNPEENPNATTFGFTKTFPTGVASANTFTLQDDGIKSYGDVKQGTGYTVDEDVIPAGWDVQNIDCSVAGHPSSGVTPVISVANGTVTFDIDSASDVLDCTYTNRASGKIVIDKVTDPANDPQKFDFTLSGGPSTLNQSFQLDHDDTPHDSGAIKPGNNYVAAEDTPTGWDQTSATCDDSNSTVANIAVSPGETVTCTFTNTKKTTDISTSQSFTPQDTATIGGSGSGTFNGQVDFELYKGEACTGTPVYFEKNVSLPASGTLKTTNGDPAGPNHSAEYTISGDGTGEYHWKVSYHDDTNGHPNASSCVEESAVTIDNDNTTP